MLPCFITCCHRFFGPRRKTGVPLLWVLIHLRMVGELWFELVARVFVVSDTLWWWWVPPLVIGVVSTVSAGRLRQGERINQRVLDRWRRLIQRLSRVRVLQRLFNCLPGFFGDYRGEMAQTGMTAADLAQAGQMLQQQVAEGHQREN